MNTQHKDIDRYIPYGEALRGFANQKFISAAELHRILNERGVFVLNNEKDFMVPLLQTLLLSPKEFDKIRFAFSQKEDNEKKISREISFSADATLFQSDLLSIDVADFLKKQLPTCELERPIRFSKCEGNPNRLVAPFKLIRHDINKSWYEQTNEFTGCVEIMNEQGKGTIRITHTAPETKELAEYIIKKQVQRLQQKGIVKQSELPKKILYSAFTNSDRFVFFYRLTTYLQNEIFKCIDIRDISIKPQDDCALPDEIQWMENMKRIIISGNSLNEKFFMKEERYYKSLELWNIEAVFSYEYKGEKGIVTISLGFPDYTTKNGNAEFEINIKSLQNERTLDVRNRRNLKSQLLLEMDKQKSVVYNNFLEYLKNK